MTPITPMIRTKPILTCDACGAELESLFAQYGEIGQSFCFSCWDEEKRIAPQRRTLEARLLDLEERFYDTRCDIQVENRWLDRIQRLESQIAKLTVAAGNREKWGG